MLYPTLPTPRKLHETDRVPVDIAMEASQKRTRAMMAKAAELAQVALDLEKEQRWTEAFSAYNDVCSYFKSILEVVESKDVSDILFVHHKYSKRMAYIKSMLKQQFHEPLSTSRYPNIVTPGTDGETTQSQHSLTESALSKAKILPPKYGRLRSDSYTNPPSTSSPLVSVRRPSLASPSASFTQTPRRSPNFKNPSAVYLSRHELKPGTFDSSEPSRFSRRVASSPSERLIASANARKETSYPQNDSLTCKYKEVTSPNQKDRHEPRRLVDLNPIPETEENQFSSYEVLKPDAKLKGSLLRPRPKLAHNPSMPNLFSAAQSQDPGYKSNGSDKERPQRSWDTMVIPVRRDSLFDSPVWGLEESQAYRSSPLNTFSILPTEDPNPEDSGTSKPDATFQGNCPDDPFFELATGLPIVEPLPAKPSTLIRTRTAPEGLQLSIQTDCSVMYGDPISACMNSPQVSSPLPSKANRTLFQVLWREEIQSKPSWIPPPTIGLLRPLWHLSCIEQTITVGGFIGTKRLFIQPSIWRQQGLKFPGLDLKIQTLAYLQDYLCRLREHWVEDVLGLTQGLEDLEVLTLNAHQALASKFSFVPPLKRSQNSATTALFSFANKISKSVERFQSNYSKDKVEGNSAYLDLLIKFIDACAFLDGWYIRFASKAITDDAYTPLLARIQRFLEFLNSVVLAFVLSDLDICLAKHLKRTRELAIE